MHKNWHLLFLIVYILILTTVSLFSFGKISSLGSEFDDKLHHVIAHAILTLLAYRYYRSTALKSILLLSFLTSVVYGIIIEVLQFTITTDRVFDLLDLLANLAGALLAIILLKFKRYLKLN